ncbi:glycosyltransferase family 4 protein [Roseibium sp. HPY-6]|uniref:glycosyltransferase family 4 protein n=1 Tax=Roseibium sp. HPY-6 TaxID=3229852 RepID=UPI00338D5E17
MFEAEPGTIEDALDMQAASPSKQRLFHLHWEHAVYERQTEPKPIERFLNQLDSFRAAGGKVIWTIHNLSPHDESKRGSNNDLQKGLLELADVLHLHSLPALAAAKAKLNLPGRKIRVIPHQNYTGAYPFFVREVARESLGLPEAGMIALCPGRIAPYKQPNELIEAFLAIAKANDRLIIAGHTEKDLEIELPEDNRLVYRNGFATPEEVGKLHAAADFIVLPYRASLTSGSAILAATLGRAVLGPDTPGLRDVVEQESTGLLYQPGNLHGALRVALGTDAKTWAERGRAAAHASAARDAVIVASAWHDVMTTLVAPVCRPRGT